MHVRSEGTGARDLVLIHGIPGSSSSWNSVIPALSPFFRIFVPDLIGFGKSNRDKTLEKLHAEAQAAALDHTLQEAGALRPWLVGHDFGGPVALRLLMRNPSSYSGLILAATNTFTDTPIPFPLGLVVSPVFARAVAPILFSPTALSGMCRFGARKGKVNLHAALGDSSQTQAIRTIFVGSLQNLKTLYGPIERFLSEIRIPTLVLWGDHDPFFPVAQARRTAEAIPGSELHILQGCGHFLPEEEPETFARLVTEFSERNAASRHVRQVS